MEEGYPDPLNYMKIWSPPDLGANTLHNPPSTVLDSLRIREDLVQNISIFNLLPVLKIYYLFIII